jgi:hypothetical protein
MEKRDLKKDKVEIVCFARTRPFSGELTKIDISMYLITSPENHAIDPQIHEDETGQAVRLILAVLMSNICYIVMRCGVQT